MDSAQELVDWFGQNLLLLVVVVGVLVVAYVYSGPFVDRAVRRTLLAADGDFHGEGVRNAELEKRSLTMVALVTTLIRLGIVSVAILIFVGLTGSEWLLIIVGLFLAGIAIAGQSIVLDYLMGIFIIVEGQFFQGDNIELGSGSWSGTVESVGLRRTVVRGVDGTVYSISNGDLRSVANRTRIYAAGEVRVRGIRQGDLAAVARVMEEVGAELASEPDFADAIITAPHLAFVEDADDLGAVAVMRGRVVAGDRWRVSTELRLRLDQALKDAGIELNRLALPDRRSSTRR